MLLFSGEDLNKNSTSYFKKNRNTWVRMGTPRPNKNSAGNPKATGTLKVHGF